MLLSVHHTFIVYQFCHGVSHCVKNRSCFLFFTVPGVKVDGHHTTVLQPFFRDHPGKLVPEENLWTLWCKGRLTEADTLSRLSSAHLHPSPHFLQAGCPSCRPTNSVKALKATSAFELGRRCLSSPQWCYLHRLRILLMDSISGISYRNKKLVLTAIKPVMHANFIFQQDSTLAHCVCHLIKLLQGKISNFLPPELRPQKP